MKFSEMVYRDLKQMYPALWEEGYWINTDGRIKIRKMTRKHIENTIGMLENKSVISVNKLNEYSNKNEQIMKCIKLLERKIEEFKTHLENGEYDKYY